MRVERKNARVCVPVRVRRAFELRASVERAAEFADLVEIRFDYLDAGEESEALKALRATEQDALPPLIYTFRSPEEGGARSTTAAERLEFWREVALLGEGRTERPAFADIELSLFESERGPELREAVNRLEVICSFHDFAGETRNLAGVYERMKRTPARIFKLAVTARDVVDCLPLVNLLERARVEARRLIAVAMGAAGVWLRVIAPAHGSFLTYAAHDAGSATAPGQLCARELTDLYRVREIDETTMITGLVGRPTAHSLSPRMHNTAFAARGLNAVYLPFEVVDAKSFVRRMAAPPSREINWRLRGLSVTAPHKSAVMPHLDSIEPRAVEVGAVNTIVVEGRELCGYNTDASAALVPLEGLFDLKGARVAVVGAGGAARAVLWALRERGALAGVFARDEGRARASAERFDARACKLDGAGFEGFDVVINATPLGTRGENVDETPARAEQLRGVAVAYDLVYNPAETRFLREARAAGCTTVGGLSMLIAQAAQQFRLWTGEPAPVEAMRAAAERRLPDDAC